MKNSDPDGFNNNYTQMGFNPRYARGPEYKPGAGVFGLFITAVIMLVIVIIIFLLISTDKNTGNDPAEDKEIDQESADEISFDNADDFTSRIFGEAGVELVQFLG